MRGNVRKNVKDKETRPKGKYVKTFKKEVDKIIYTVTETTVVGRDFEIMNFQREYNPPIPSEIS